MNPANHMNTNSILTNTTTSNSNSNTPPFPEPGSILSNRYFCLGRLGRGTFCSIHQCIDLSYYHSDNNDNENEIEQADKGAISTNNHQKPKSRLVAAKVELTQFSNSGVVDGEAIILSHLSKHLPPNSIPIYHDYAKTGGLSAIIMEYLPGEDMHQLRERHCTLLIQMQQKKQQQQQPLHSKNKQLEKQSQPQSSPSSALISSTKCRVNLRDAVYLTADCILPLLEQMHCAGVIHRDVKPNNCVRMGTSESDKRFKMVDFGLSKSLVVPSTSSLADLAHPWKLNRSWHSAANTGGSSTNGGSEENSNPCLRKERPIAEFRGTSMYASLRVHQSRDYGRRDDIWGLLYVFCDLVSGGLPWMKQAGERDREMCKKMKEFVHGEGNELMQLHDIQNPKLDKNGNVSEPEEGEEVIYKDHIEDLLKGAAHHMGKQKKKQQDLHIGNSNSHVVVPPPLALSMDSVRVNHLRNAFKHVSKLTFQDAPDYKYIQKCLHGFLPSKEDPKNVQEEDAVLPPIDWNMPPSSRTNKSNHSRKSTTTSSVMTQVMERLWPQQYVTKSNTSVPPPDPITPLLLEEAEQQRLLQLQTQANVTYPNNHQNNNNSNGNNMNNNNNPNASNSNSTSPSTYSSEQSLPISIQFYLAQAEYNARHTNTIPKTIALNHWMQLGFSLLFVKWSMKYEKGKRKEGDGYRREEYMKLLKRCLEAAVPFQMFQSPDYYDFDVDIGVKNGVDDSISSTNGDVEQQRACKRRRLSAFSVILCGLRGALEREEEKKFAPPPTISFSGPMSSVS